MSNKTKGWSDKRRAAQAERCRKNKPSQFSTGPRTEEGKEAVKYNSLRHGMRSAEMQRLSALMQEHKNLIRALSPKNQPKPD